MSRQAVEALAGMVFPARGLAVSRVVLEFENGEVVEVTRDRRHRGGEDAPVATD